MRVIYTAFKNCSALNVIFEANKDASNLSIQKGIWQKPISKEKFCFFLDFECFFVFDTRKSLQSFLSKKLEENLRVSCV